MAWPGWPKEVVKTPSVTAKAVIITSWARIAQTLVFVSDDGFFFLGGQDAGPPQDAVQVKLLNGRSSVHASGLLYSKTLAIVVPNRSVHAKARKCIAAVEFLNKRFGGSWGPPGWPEGVIKTPLSQPKLASSHLGPGLPKHLFL